MFDAGVNLLDKRFDPFAVIENAIEAGISGLLVISSDLDESQAAQDFCNQYTSKACQLRFTAGVHPHAAKTWDSQSSHQLKLIAADKLCVAIGECGLDFNRNFSSPEEQEYAFTEQLKLAKCLSMGLYLHERDAFKQQLQLLNKYAGDVRFKIAHCFTGNEVQLSAYLAMGCYIGITGWLDDEKRAFDLRSAVKNLPLHRLLLETDAPYLFPKSIRPRAKNNEPKFLGAIASVFAALTNNDIVDVKQASMFNAAKLFLSD
ncbi:TatD family hydrolase [Agaribacter flavus]|uniref:TatD family hydrolase n=1 Tax=Agaribacter flavus TaxID=1902781 RepID=A0ABV7FPW6_9ALTE